MTSNGKEARRKEYGKGEKTHLTEEHHREPVDVTQQARRAAEEPREDNLVQGDEREKLSRQRQRNALETQLRHAVETENFEEAAKLRDQLRSLPQA